MSHAVQLRMLQQRSPERNLGSQLISSQRGESPCLQTAASWRTPLWRDVSRTYSFATPYIRANASLVPAMLPCDGPPLATCGGWYPGTRSCGTKRWSKQDRASRLSSRQNAFGSCRSYGSRKALRFRSYCLSSEWSDPIITAALLS